MHEENPKMGTMKRMNAGGQQGGQADPWWDLEVAWTGAFFLVVMGIIGFLLLWFDFKGGMYFFAACLAFASPAVVSYMRGNNESSLKGGSVVALCVIAGLAVAIATHEKLIAAPEAARKAAIARANQDGDAKARLAFQSWRALTEQDGTALTWSGKTAEIVLVTRHDSTNKTKWNILARSEGGRYFEVWAQPSGDQLTMQIVSGVQPLEEGVVVRLLTAADRIDLIQKLNLPLKPA